jgi:hypothetical protein
MTGISNTNCKQCSKVDLPTLKGAVIIIVPVSMLKRSLKNGSGDLIVIVTFSNAKIALR